MKLKLPARITVSDYHEFNSIAGLLRQIGVKAKVKEVGFVDGKYVGIMYTGRLTDAKNKKLISQIRNEENEMYFNHLLSVEL